MFRKIAVFAILIVFIVGATALYTFGMRYVGSGKAPQMANKSAQATRIRVDKSDRRLTLFQGDHQIMDIPISLGNDPIGHKAQEGDERTPTGTYEIDWRNPNSIAHLSLHISYPNTEDVAHAEQLGVSPGGDIMIHGIANGWGLLGGLHRFWDWTNGCIAVTNTEMKTIWSLVPNGTPIEIVE
jgi:murein L,D-transpeptidase YafK